MTASSPSEVEVESSVALHTLPVVFVVDDDVSVRESLELLIRHEGWRVETFVSAQDFLDRPRSLAAGCLVLDIAMPGLNGLELQKRVVAERPEMPIIFITGHGDIPMTVQAMKAGAVEFLTKPISNDALLQAIRKAIERSVAWLGRDARLRALKDRYARLTVREREVMALVVEGLPNKQVADELGISEVTVKAHRGSMMRKMTARSLPELVNLAMHLRLNRTKPSMQTTKSV
jgi:FixJ family two-component response regulator